MASPVVKGWTPTSAAGSSHRGFTLLELLVVISINLAADLLYTVLDPRIR